MTPEQIQHFRRLEAVATGGPWHPFVTDDWMGMNVVGVGTADDLDETPPENRAGEIVALTLYQADRVASHDATRWDQDAWLIAEVRNALPELLDDWERMRDLVEDALPYLPAATATQETFCATVGHPTDPSDGRGRCYCQHYKPTRTLDDGFGNVWAKCERADCGLQLVRPGKVQCSRCDEVASLDPPDQPVKDS